jgi:hypothetical protein
MRAPVAKTMIVAAAAVALSGCVTQAKEHMSADFGVAYRQDIAAQIAYPDARYTGDPAPGSSGARVGLAQDRYVRGEVIEPAAATAASGVVGAEPNKPSTSK